MEKKNRNGKGQFFLRDRSLVICRNQTDIKCIIFSNVPTPASFLLFLFFATTIYGKIVGFSGIRTQIVQGEGEHTDHLTTTTALKMYQLQLEAASVTRPGNFLTLGNFSKPLATINLPKSPNILRQFL